jgi:release factor glutamine methyltransferase
VFSVEDSASTLSAFRPSEEDLQEEDEASLDNPISPKPAAASSSRPGAPAHPKPGVPGHRGTPVLKRGRAGGPAWRIADVGTGSGCIAIALAKNLPRAAVIATDVSTDALDLAIENAARHAVGGRIEFRHGQLLEPLQGERFDIIASNPPYIPDDEWDGVPPNVKDHEPHLALRGGADGLDLIRPLVAGAAALLNPGGWLVLETAASRAGATADLARAAGLVEIRILKDLEGLDRVVVARAGTPQA